MMFKKLLVANRGEIAVRVMRGCRDLGISTVAIYSDLDVEAVHTSYADEAYNVGPGPAAQSYLNIDAIIEAARKSGAEAVHPGYGFLAENAGFARAVTDAGLTWVGPAADVIDAMGDKVAARRAATDAGVATVPGTPQPVTTPAEVEAFATQHGLPLAIKASAGGGGKGFRVVADLAEASEALSGAAREALAYFSSPDVYLERYLQRPRHIEIQVLGDASGAIVSFPERDCSLQRRHQKLIEESPSPALEPQVREAIMEAAAVGLETGWIPQRRHVRVPSRRRRHHLLFPRDEYPAAGRASGYRVGDVDRSGGRTVAHRRERTTQLLAGRHRASWARDRMPDQCRGPRERIHAFSGNDRHVSRAGGPGVRVDSGMAPGTTVSQAYDPLISKLITFGGQREEARRRMLRALSEYTIEGLRTSIPFHQLMLQDDGFITGNYHTGTVENELDLSVLPDVSEEPSDFPEQTAAATPRPRARRQALLGRRAGATGGRRPYAQARSPPALREGPRRRRRGSPRADAGHDRQGVGGGRR